MLKKIAVLSLLSVKTCFGMESEMNGSDKGISYNDYINSFVPLENEINQENINPTDQKIPICPNAPKKALRVLNYGELRAIPINFNNVNFVGFDDDNMDVEMFNYNRFAGEAAFQL